MKDQMVAATFRRAFEAAIMKYPLQIWNTLTPHDQSVAIYQEMRRLDAESVRLKETEEEVKHLRMRKDALSHLAR